MIARSIQREYMVVPSVHGGYVAPPSLQGGYRIDPSIQRVYMVPPLSIHGGYMIPPSVQGGYTGLLAGLHEDASAARKPLDCNVPIVYFGDSKYFLNFTQLVFLRL